MTNTNKTKKGKIPFGIADRPLLTDKGERIMLSKLIAENDEMWEHTLKGEVEDAIKQTREEVIEEIEKEIKGFMYLYEHHFKKASGYYTIWTELNTVLELLSQLKQK